MYIVNPKKILRNYRGKTPWTRPDHVKGAKARRDEAWAKLRESLRGTDLVDPRAI